MGYNPEPPDEDGIYDIYIQDMGQGYYGVNNLDSDLKYTYFKLNIFIFIM